MQSVGCYYESGDGTVVCDDDCAEPSLDYCPTVRCKGVRRREEYNVMSFLRVTAFLFMVWILLLHFCPYCDLKSGGAGSGASLLICIETDRKKPGLSAPHKKLTGRDRWDFLKQSPLWENPGEILMQMF